MVTICGNASVFKTNSQADLENYTPSLENMKKIVALLYHDTKWQSDENIRERYESSILPGAWETLSAARLRSPVHQVRSTTEEFVKQLSQLTIPLLIMSCEHDPLNQSDWDVNFQKIVPGSKVHRFKHSAHEPQIEETEEFNRVLTRIFASEGDSIMKIGRIRQIGPIGLILLRRCGCFGIGERPRPAHPAQDFLQRADREYGSLLARQRGQDF